MAVVSVRQLGRGWGYSDSTDLIREHTIMLRAKTDDVDDDGFTVGSSILIPQLWTPHPVHAGSTLRKRTFDKEGETKFTWLARLEYSTETEDETDNENDPSDPSIRVSWKTQQGTRIIEEDINGDAILNSLGYSPERPVEIPMSNDVLTISRNELTYSAATSMAYKDHVNSATFAGYPIDTVLCRAIDADLQYKQGTFFYRVTYEFEYNRKGWQLAMLNESRIVYRVGGTYGRPVDSDGRDLNFAVPINMAGEQIPAGSLPAGAIYLDFDVIPRANFNSLGLGV